LQVEFIDIIHMNLLVVNKVDIILELLVFLFECNNLELFLVLLRVRLTQLPYQLQSAQSHLLQLTLQFLQTLLLLSLVT